MFLGFFAIKKKRSSEYNPQSSVNKWNKSGPNLFNVIVLHMGTLWNKIERNLGFYSTLVLHNEPHLRNL